MPPLPDVDTEEMENPIIDKLNRLPEYLKFDPSYVHNNPGWLGILEAEQGGADQAL